MKPHSHAFACLRITIWSAIACTAVIGGFFVFIPQAVRAQQHSKFIRDDATGGDCTSIGVWDQTAKTCTLTQDVSGTIQIESDGVTLDGNHRTVSGAGSGSGVYLTSRTGVTVKNLTVADFSGGIVVALSSFVTIAHTTTTDNIVGFSINSANDVSLLNNAAIGNTERGIIVQSSLRSILTTNTSQGSIYGIELKSAGGAVLSGNAMSGNRYNFLVDGTAADHFDHDIDATNTVEGEPIRYFKNITDQTFDGAVLPAGTIACISCRRVVFTRFTLSSSSGFGILLWDTHDVRIEDSAAAGNDVGVWLVRSHNNAVERVSASGNEIGVMLDNSGGNTITDSTFVANTNAFYLDHADHNNFTGNVVTGTGQAQGSTGALLYASGGNVVSGNTFQDTSYNFWIFFNSPTPAPNTFHRNNFIRYFAAGGEVFMGGGDQFSQPLPVGGNYWDGYDSPAEGCSDINNDRICDSPHLFPGGQDDQPWTVQDGWKTPQLDPVILIPGITGSWNWDVLLRDNANTQEPWKFTPFSNVYQPLIEELKENGYEEGKTLFVAFYDWRQPNVLSSQTYLKPLIDQAKQASGGPRVDLIAHSMGGILARAYIQGGHYENDVDQFFMLGTPNQGSSDVYAPWEGGHVPENWDTSLRVPLKTYLFFSRI